MAIKKSISLAVSVFVFLLLAERQYREPFGLGGLFSLVFILPLSIVHWYTIRRICTDRLLRATLVGVVGPTLLVSGCLALGANYEIRKMTLAGGIHKELGLSMKAVEPACLPYISNERKERLKSERLLFTLIMVLCALNYAHMLGRSRQ